jgi:hypothetical protein
MPEYLVTWRIDVEAETPYEAAVEAWSLQMGADSSAVVFDVASHENLKEVVRIDLDPAEPSLTPILHDPTYGLGKDYWSEHPTFIRSDWVYEVSGGNTNQGYWEWVASSIESNESDERLRASLDI